MIGNFRSVSFRVLLSFPFLRTPWGRPRELQVLPWWHIATLGANSLSAIGLVGSPTSVSGATGASAGPSTTASAGAKPHRDEAKLHGRGPERQRRQTGSGTGRGTTAGSGSSSGGGVSGSRRHRLKLAKALEDHRAEHRWQRPAARRAATPLAQPTRTA